MARTVQLTPWIDLAHAIAGQRVVSASIGPAGEAVMVLVEESMGTAPDGYDEQPGGARFPHSQAPVPAATVLIHDGRSERRIVLREPPFAYPQAQPLPDGKVLLVGVRCERLPDGTAERNARIYAEDGTLQAEATLGDGIQSVQTTRGGDIWVSYFDEGVFGSSGWGNDEDSTPIGAAGLVRFDMWGNKRWEYRPPEGLGAIDDCYALNVTDEAAWAYYYADFPIVRIDADDRVTAWHTDVAGAGAFAVTGRRVLLFGGYRQQRARCLLGVLGDGAIEQPEECTLILPSGESIGAGLVFGRGPLLCVFSGSEWYRVDSSALP